jgi:hypothetical protein
MKKRKRTDAKRIMKNQIAYAENINLRGNDCENAGGEGQMTAGRTGTLQEIHCIILRDAVEELLTTIMQESPPRLRHRHDENRGVEGKAGYRGSFPECVRCESTMAG